jgi:hypothetical protein
MPESTIIVLSTTPTRKRNILSVSIHLFYLQVNNVLERLSS